MTLLMKSLLVTLLVCKVQLTEMLLTFLMTAENFATDFIITDAADCSYLYCFINNTLDDPLTWMLVSVPTLQTLLLMNFQLCR